MSTFKKMAGIGVVLGGIAVALTGCSAGGGDHPTDQAATQSAGLSVPAGDDARALGVEEWRLDDNGFIDGVDTAGSVVAQFHAIREEHRVESLLPDKGVKSVDDPQAANTFSARSSELYEVMIYDLSVFARTQAQPSSDTTQGSGLGTEREAYWSVGYNCCYGSSSAIYYTGSMTTGKSRRIVTSTRSRTRAAAIRNATSTPRQAAACTGSNVV